MLKHIKLIYKLPLFVVGLLLITSAITYAVIFHDVRDLILNDTAQALDLVATQRAKEVDAYMQLVRNGLLIQASNPVLPELFEAEEKQPRDELFFDQLNLDDIALRRGYEDALLFDTSGNLFFSAVHQKTAPDTYLAAFHMAQNLKAKETLYIDFKFYDQENPVPTAFMIAPIFSKQGKRLGGIAFQISAQAFSQITAQQEGVGLGGHVLLIGPDHFLRADYAKEIAGTVVLKESIDDQAADDALKGDSGFGEMSFEGELHYVAYRPVTVGAVQWAVLILKDYNEVLRPLEMLQNSILTDILWCCSWAILLSLWLARLITVPILRIASAMRGLAEGELNTAIPVSDHNDEIGAMVKAVIFFKEKMLETQRLKEEKKAFIAQMANEFETGIGSILRIAAKNVSELRSLSDGMADMSRTASIQTGDVSKNAAQVSRNVQSVAAATQELTTTTRDISAQVAQSSHIAKQGAEKAMATGVVVNELTDSAAKVSDVIKLINAIAEQTNLLALNATIEAARAGDAGRGFAVVAAEVKNLAAQTKHATDDITVHIQAMQNATTQTVGSVDALKQSIMTMDQISAGIAAAMEEQSTATSDIARNMQEAFTATDKVSGHVSSLSHGAEEAGAAASQVVAAAEALNEQVAVTLNEKVDAFLKTIRG